MSRPRHDAELQRGTLVFVPSLTFDPVELAKITGVGHYETRMLYSILQLAHPDRRLVFVTSEAVDPAVVNYYLRFLDDPEDARRRLHLVSLDDPDPRPLTAKLLGRPDVVAQIKDLVSGDPEAWMQTFIVKAGEEELAAQLGLPLFGPTAEQAALGLKTGARRSARAADVAVCPGDEDLHSLPEVEAAIDALPHEVTHVVIKLNDGFSGIGNAIIDLSSRQQPLSRTPTLFGSESESWATYESKIALDGAIVEALITDPQLCSPSAQIRITPAGDVELLSTHDQVLGGPGGHVYLGCRFPAAEPYRRGVQEAAEAVAAVLAEEGVMGSFGFDFLVPSTGEIVLAETNLRLGGTTHPYWMARLATGATADPVLGTLTGRDGRPRCYVASDNIKSADLVGRPVDEVIGNVDAAGLSLDRDSGVGVTLHLLGALRDHGKMGAVAIDTTVEAAQARYDELVGLLGAPRLT